MITVAGISPSLDLTYSVESLRLGQIQRSDDVVRCAGGKPLNMARAAATLGGAVSVVAILGGPTGDLLAHALAADGVEVLAVPTPYETRTCVSISSVETGELTEVYQNAAAIPASVWSAFGSTLRTALESRPGWLVVNGGAPSGLDAAAYADLVSVAHHRGVRVAVDTYGPGLAAAIEVRPDLVKVNRDEAAGLLGAGADADALELAAELQRRTGEAAVVTDGVRGVALVDERQRLRATLPGTAGTVPGRQRGLVPGRAGQRPRPGPGAGRRTAHRRGGRGRERARAGPRVVPGVRGAPAARPGHIECSRCLTWSTSWCIWSISGCSPAYFTWPRSRA